MTRTDRFAFRRRMEKLRDIVLALEALPEATDRDHELVQQLDRTLSWIYDQAVDALAWARRKYDEVA